MNELVKFYRESNPSDARSDDEITLQFAKDHGVDNLLKKYPGYAADYNRIQKEFRMAFAPSLPREFTRALASGTDQVQAKLYDTVGLAGDVIGSDALSRFGTEGYHRNIREAEENQPTIPNFTDVEGPMEFLRYGAGLVGSQAPQYAGLAAASLAGGAIGVLAAPAAIPAAVAAGIGSAIGAGALGFSQIQNRGELLDMEGVDQASVVPTALGVGAIGAALEAITPVKVAGKLLRLAKFIPALEEAGEETAKRYIAQVARQVPRQALEEGSTEVAQEVVSMAGELYANRNNPKFNLDQEQVWNRLINSGAAGAFLGGATGFIPQRFAPRTEGQETDSGPGGEHFGDTVTSGPEAGKDKVSFEDQAKKESEESLFYSKRHKEKWILKRAAELEMKTLPRKSAEWFEAEKRMDDAYVNGGGREPVNRNNPLVSVPILIEPGIKMTHRLDITGAKWDGGVNDFGTRGITLVSGEKLWVEEQLLHPEQIWALDDNTQAIDTKSSDSPKSEIEASEIPQPPEADLRSDLELKIEKFKQAAAMAGQSAGELKMPNVNAPAPRPPEIPKFNVPHLPLDLDKVDFEGSSLRAEATKRGLHKDKEASSEVEQQEFDPNEEVTRVSEKAFFEVPSPAYSKELAERLSSDARATNEKNSNTRRITFFEDIQTGAVVGLPTHYTNKKEEGKVVRVGPYKEKTGTTLEKFMADGRYVPIASARLSQEVSGTDKQSGFYYPDSAVFEREFVRPAKQQMKKLISYANDTPAKTQRVATNAAGKTIELRGEDSDENPIDVFKDAMTDHLPKEVVNGKSTIKQNLTADDVKQAIFSAMDDSNNPEYGQSIAKLMRAQIADGYDNGSEDFRKFQNLPTGEQNQFLVQMLAERTHQILEGSQQSLGANVKAPKSLPPRNEERTPIRGSSVTQTKEPEIFDSVGAIMDFREKRFEEEIYLLQEQIGITIPQARKLSKLMRQEADTEILEQGLSSDQRKNLDRFYHNSPVNEPGSGWSHWETSKRWNPDNIVGEEDEKENGVALASVLWKNSMSSLVNDRGVSSDRFVYAVIAALQFKDAGGALSDFHKYAGIVARSESNKQSDYAYVLKDVSEKAGAFLRRIGVSLPLHKQKSTNDGGKQAAQLASPDAAWDTLYTTRSLYAPTTPVSTPTGKPSKLTPMQQRQVRTPEFKAWFGDWENDPANASKVIDPETGEPMVVYHFTPNSGFSVFQEQKSGLGGFFFSPKPINTSGFDPDGSYPVYLNIRNPKGVSDRKSVSGVNTSFNKMGYYDKASLVGMGVDGLFGLSVGGKTEPLFRGNNISEIIALDSTQIKSAIGNSGEFSSSNPDIRFTEGGNHRASTGQYKARTNQLMERLNEFGYATQIVEATNEEFGKINFKERLVTFVLHDAENPSADNLRIVLHEAAHAVFKDDPNRDVIIAMIASAKDEDLGIADSPDPRIRSSNPAGLPQGILQEERMAEWLAAKGFSAEVAQGIAAALVRFVKDLYYRAAIAMQKAFGRTPSDSLAKGYALNRFGMFQAGNKPMNLLQFIIPPQRFDADAALEMYTIRTEKIGERTVQAVVVETSIAASNAQAEVDVDVAKALDGTAFANEARKNGKVPFEDFRNVFGIPNPEEEIKAQMQQAIDPATGSALTVRADARIDSFKAEQNRQSAAQLAYKKVMAIYRKVSAKVTKTRKQIDDTEAERVKAAEEVKELTVDYTNVDGLTKLMVRDLKKAVKRAMRDAVDSSYDLGVVTQQLEALGVERDTLKLYAPVFRKLFTGVELDKIKLFDIMDVMANDPNIDFAQDIRRVREAMKDSGKKEYLPLLQDTVEGKALLATVVAYAKTNDLVMLMTELRRFTNIQSRAKIHAEMKRLLESGDDLIDTIKNIPRSAAIEDRIKQSLAKKKSKLKSLVNKRERLKRELKAAEVAADVYRAGVNKLAGPNQVHAPVVFHNGMEIYVPTSNKATGLGDGFEIKKIFFDASGRITSRSEFDAWEVKILDWLDTNTPTNGSYFYVKKMFDEMQEHGRFGADVRNTDYSTTELRLSDMATQAKAFGTPSGRVVAQMANNHVGHVETLRPQAEALGLKVELTQAKAAKALGMGLEYYLSNYYHEAVDFLEGQRDLLESVVFDTEEKQLKEAFKRMQAYFDLDEHKKRVELSKADPKFFALLREHIEAEWKASEFYRNYLDQHNVGVRDDSLLVELERGKFVTGERKAKRQGLVTIPVTFRDSVMGLYAEMVEAGWNGFVLTIDSIAPMYNEFGAGEVAKNIGTLFANKVIQDELFYALAVGIDTGSPFHAPIFDDGVTRPEADPAKVSQAYEASGGDVVKFAELLYDLHHGTTDKGDYVQGVMQTFVDYFGELSAWAKKKEAQGQGVPVDSFSSVIPEFMVTARKVQHYPASWRKHVNFDQRTILSATQKVAAEIAFGIGGERMDKAYDQMVKEVQADEAKLRIAIERVKGKNKSGTHAEGEKLLIAEVGGKDELARLRKNHDRARFAYGTESIRTQFVNYFRGKSSPVKTATFMRETINLFTSAMLNQFGSAITQFADNFAMLLSFGVSGKTIRYMARTMGSTAHELAGGLVEALGVQLKTEDRTRQRLLERGFGDSMKMTKIKDIVFGDVPTDYQSDQRVIGALTTGANKLRRLQNNPTGFGDGPKTFTRFRLLAPFTQVATAVNVSSALNMHRMFDDFIFQGVMWGETHTFASDLADKPIDWWAKELKLGALEKQTFIKLFSAARDDWGLDFFSLVKEGQKNLKGGKDITSDKAFNRITAMTVKEISSESNIATMPSWAFNNSIARHMLPLMAWSFRRAMKVVGGRLDENGKWSYSALARMLGALAVMTVGGLGVSMLVDLYNEDLLAKRRNLRQLSTDLTKKESWLALLEHTTRVGTFGLLGDTLNSAVDVGTGEGANRGVSLDQRVVFLNSIRGLLNGISTFINEDFSTDYATVIRPVAFAVGGNGVLQYLQLMNNAFGLDNEEARATSRTNVGNWLRVTGRELGLEVKKMGGSGGYLTPTKMTPIISDMALSAYANDMAGFKTAYREAVSTAKELKQDDPADYVQRMFLSRHPLRSVFRTALSESDYDKVIAALPDNGKEAVTGAVKNFNRFSVSIGGKPFEGRQHKTQPQHANPFAAGFSQILGRAKSASALYGFEAGF